MSGLPCASGGLPFATGYAGSGHSPVRGAQFGMRWVVPDPDLKADPAHGISHISIRLLRSLQWNFTKRQDTLQQSLQAVHAVNRGSGQRWLHPWPVWSTVISINKDTLCRPLPMGEGWGEGAPRGKPVPRCQPVQNHPCGSLCVLDTINTTMKKKSTTLRKILSYGQLESISYTQNRKIFNVNSASLIAVVSALLYSLNLLIFIDINVAIVNIIAALPFLLLYLVPIWLNYHYYHKYARLLISASITASVFFSILVISGTHFDLHYYFILFSIVPLLFFSSREWYSLLFFYFINIGLFVKIEYFGINTWFEINQYVDPESQFYLKASSVAVSLLTLWFTAFLSERAAQLNEERLEKLSDHDLLTGLANRRCFEQKLASAFKIAHRNNGLGAVMFIDLDNFKPLNDTHGHLMGDLLLKEASSRISKAVRATDLVARFGGDEFVVLFPPINADMRRYRENIEKVAHKIQNIISQPFSLKDDRDDASRVVSHVCTASIGVAFYDHTEDINTLVERADKAMYQAKRQGKNQICVIA